MNVTQRRKANGNGEKPFPGCLGRMVNLFDLSNGVASNRMLTDRPHHDGSSLGRSQSDVARMSSPFGDKIEDKLIVSEFRRTLSNKKANGTPIKMLIDQEMSKEIESKSEPPNVVAKLMGLDAFPRQHPHPSLQRSNTTNYSKPPFSHSGMPLSSWQQEDGFSENRMQFDVHHCPERNEYKDVYEVWQEPENKTCIKDKSPQKERHNANTNDRNMALVRQKFAEAKRLATDEKLRQSEEFKDALEVLNSNRDLLIKIFNESTPAFSQHLYELQSMPPPPETKRITVLRPSKIVDKEKISGSRPKSDKPTDNFPQLGQTAMLDKINPENSPMFSDQKVDEYPMQPTRIVVLKPSSGKTHDIRAVTQPIASSKLFHEQNIYEDPEDDEARESREVAKEITRHVRDNLMGHHRDETLLSSVFSNGYTGDESSFNKSEIEYVAEILSDQEVMSPSSRHSWDYINRIGSPFSSSFSRASCSPESSVCREAKKRLSERWAMMASTSNGNSQEFRHVRRSSSTLGEMLALSDMKKSVRPEEKNKEQEPRKLVSCLIGDSIKEDDCNSPKSLLRSQSLPVSSTVFGARLNMSISDAVADRTDGPKELTKAKSTKSSLKGKVSSLFFSRSKKSSKEKSGSSGPNGESQYASAETPRFLLPPGKIDAVSQSSSEIGLEERLPSVSCLSGIVSREGGLSLTKPTVSRGVGENQDQPSPISVLEPHFEEYETSGYSKLDVQGGLLRSNLIDKSPPIESIARTLSWDDSCVETATSYTLKPSSVPIVCEEDEQEWLAFVQTLLSAAGLSRETGSDTRDSVLHRWQTPEAPLDPSLRDKYANVDDKEPMHEAKRRYLRSTRKLVFDYVNTALADVTGYGPDTSLSITCNGAHDRLLEGDSPPLLVDCLWGQMKDWFSGELRCCWEDGGDAASLVVDGVVRKEIVGKGWNELTRLEMDNIGKEIEGSLMETLMKEAVVDLTGRF